MLRWLWIAIFYVFLLGRSSAQIININGLELFIDQTKIREQKIKILTITYDALSRKKPGRKFKRVTYAKTDLHFDEQGSHRFTVNGYYNLKDEFTFIDTVYFQVPAPNPSDSLLYNNKKQLVKIINSQTKCVTLLRYDSLGRKTYTFFYDSTNTGYSYNKFEISHHTYDTMNREIRSVIKKGYAFQGETTKPDTYQEINYTFDAGKLLCKDDLMIDFLHHIKKWNLGYHITQYYEYVNGIPAREYYAPPEKEDLDYPEVIINLTECEPLKW